MKNKLRRVLSGVMTAAIAVSMAVPSFAAEMSLEEQLKQAIRDITNPNFFTDYEQFISDTSNTNTKKTGRTPEEAVAEIKEQYSQFNVKWIASGKVFEEKELRGGSGGLFYTYSGDKITIYKENGEYYDITVPNLRALRSLNELGYGVAEDNSFNFAVIDQYGNFPIPFGRYDVIDEFNGKYAYVYKNGMLGVVDVTTGKEIVPAKYTSTMAYKRYELYGFDLNKYFEQEKLMPVERYGYFGYVDKNGTEVIPCIYDYAEIFSEGLAYVRKDGQGFIINTKNETVGTLPKGYQGWYFSEGLIMVTDTTVFPEMYGYCDAYGNIVIKPQYLSGQEFTGGVAIVRDWSGMGVVDRKNNVIVPFGKYEAVKYSGDKDRLLGFIQRVHPVLGVVTTTSAYYAASIIGTDGKIYVDNCVLINPYSRFENGVIAFSTMSGYESEWGKAEKGYLDRNGNVVVSFSKVLETNPYVEMYPVIRVEVTKGQAGTYGNFYGYMFGVVQVRPNSQNQSAVNAKYSNSRIMVNGKQVELEVYNISDNNYFKLRDIAKIVSGTPKQFEVYWNDSKNSIELTSGKAYTPVGGELARGNGKDKTGIPCRSTIFKDGQQLELKAYTINDNNYFKLRDVCRAFDIGVFWDEATGTVSIDTSRSYVEG